MQNVLVGATFTTPTVRPRCIAPVCPGPIYRAHMCGSRRWDDRQSYLSPAGELLREAALQEMPRRYRPWSLLVCLSDSGWTYESYLRGQNSPAGGAGNHRGPATSPACA